MPNAASWGASQGPLAAIAILALANQQESECDKGDGRKAEQHRADGLGSGSMASQEHDSTSHRARIPTVTTSRSALVSGRMSPAGRMF
jgi:hypothetical protein